MSDQDERSASEELREGFGSLFRAARKAIKTAEPTFTRSLDDAERMLDKLGRGGEAVAHDVGKELAAAAARLADRLRAVADKVDAKTAGEAHDDAKGAVPAGNTENDGAERSPDDSSR